MAKGKPEPISSPGPTGGKTRDLAPLMDMLRDLGVTFAGAKRGHGVGVHDRGPILAVAQKAAETMTRNEAVTAAHSAYWRLFDEHQRE